MAQTPKQPNKDNVPFEGGKKMRTPSTVVDKSGAKHTPFSRVRHLARLGMKGVKEEYNVCPVCKEEPCVCEVGQHVESVTHLRSFSNLRAALFEKTLTPAEKKKREEVAKAIERENPKMPMGMKMAIATKTAKRVAEDTEQISEALSPGYMLKADPKLAQKFKEKQDAHKAKVKAMGNPAAGKSVKEDTEQIDELKKSTITSYINKTVDPVYGIPKGGKEKIQKRLAGLTRAHQRIVGEKPMTKEEVEQVDETKSAPKGFHFTKDGKLKRGDADRDGSGGAMLRSDPLDKQRSKVPPVSEAAGLAGMSLDQLKQEHDKVKSKIEAEGKSKMISMNHPLSQRARLIRLHMMIKRKGEREAANEETELDEAVPASVNKDRITTHENPLVTVHAQTSHGKELHTHANLKVANDIHGTNVKASDVHKGPVKSGSLTFSISKHHEKAVEDEKKFWNAYGESVEDQHYCAKHVRSALLGDGVVLESQHADPDENGNIEWYFVEFKDGIRKVYTEDLEIMLAEYHGNHKKKKRMGQ